MLQMPFFHIESDSVRFSVLVNGLHVGASIGKATLHYRWHPRVQDDDPLATYMAHAAEIDAAVRRRLSKGAREPVLLRDADLLNGPA